MKRPCPTRVCTNLEHMGAAPPQPKIEPKQKLPRKLLWPGQMKPTSLPARRSPPRTCPTSFFYLRPPASTPPPFDCLGKHSLCNIITFSSIFKLQEILFSLQTCTFLKKRRFSEDVVFQKSTSRQHGSTRFRIRRLPGATRDKPTTY